MKTTKTKKMKTTKKITIMKNMKKLMYLSLGVLFLSACSKSSDNDPLKSWDCIDGGCVELAGTNGVYASLASCQTACGETPIQTEYSGQITEDVTWTNDNIYVLDGRVTVISGVTLTIEAGTVIKAEGGQDADASCLLIARGGKLMANGTASMPIIFTSVADDISNSHASYPGFANLNETQNNLWGGVLILGNAPISAASSEVQIEGIPASDANGLYGGSNASDNSGSLTYVQIRHGGTSIGEGNEINGLTLGGVGSGTTLNYIEVLGNQDDGFEFFGGTVDASNLLVWGQGDDAFDVDQAYSGTVNNFLGILIDGDQGLEIDGWEGTLQADFTLMNGTIIGAEGLKNNCGTFKSKASGSVSNMLFKNMKEGAYLKVDAGATGITFSDISFEAGYTQTLTDGLGTTNFNDNNNGTGGANLSKFDGWSCAGKQGAY